MLIFGLHVPNSLLYFFIISNAFKPSKISKIFTLSSFLVCIIYHCAVPENIHTPPTEGIGISWGVGSSMRPKNLKKCMKLNWNFQRGGEVSEKIPSMGEV